jgi:hypothetical protein
VPPRHRPAGACGTPRRPEARGAPGTELLGPGHDIVEHLQVPAHHDLTGSVHVGQPGPVRCDGARLDGERLLSAQEDGQAARLRLLGIGRGIGAGHGEPQSVVERHRAGGDEGGDLSERVAGHRRDRLIEQGLERSPGHERGEEDRQLAVSGVGQLLGIGVEQETGERTAGGALGIVDERPSGMGAPRRTEARGLSALTREGDGKAHACNSWGDRVGTGAGTAPDGVMGVRRRSIAERFTYPSVTLRFGVTPRSASRSEER